jgi:starch synthase
MIEGGADMFLMPSKYEPCGLNQMMSMRYGALPIVRATGGLADTVTDADKDPQNGTGFSFSEYHPGALLAAVRRAVRAFGDAAGWRRLQINAMSRDFSWDRSAREYVRLYERALSRPPRSLL